MKICRFRRSDLSVGWGLLTSSGIQDITLADPTLPIDTVDLIKRWSHFEQRILYLSKRLGVNDEPMQLLAPISKPGKILCIGLNYRDHAAETGAAIPDEPIVFCKMATAMVGDGEAIVLPPVSDKVDYEAELVVVLGSDAKNVDVTAAEEAIFGYSVGHDVSARDWQTGKPAKQWFLGKSFDTFAPLGPAIVKKSEVPNPNELAITCKINGELMQNGNTREMIFKPAELVSYISQVMTLNAGDVIYTGTPPGVGTARKPPRYLQDNDVVEIEIEQIGKLSNRCVRLL